MFTNYSDLKNNVEGAYEALKYCIKHGVCISGEVVQWLVDNHSELIVDEVYDDFGDSGRWSINKSYILKIDDEHYRCWEEVGLTEMQPNDWWDQTFEKVVLREVRVDMWLTEGEASY